MSANAPGGIVERLTAADLLLLRTDVGPAPMHIGAALLLGDGAPAGDVEEVLQARLSSVRRLRQVVVTPPPGLGRPYWREDPSFDAGDHVRRVALPDLDRVDSVLELAAEEVTRPLPPSRPLWRATVVVAPGGDRAGAVVVVLHHALADGLGGLGLLGRLVDHGAQADAVRTGGSATARPAVGGRELLSDRAVGLLDTLVTLPAAAAPALVRARHGWGELGHSLPRAAPRTSFNRPTGARRVVRVVTVRLAPTRAAARRHGATVNDLLLTAVAGALGEALRRLGEQVDELVISVPVSGRPLTSRDLGNRTGIMPVRVPVSGPAGRRLAEVSARTRARKSQVRGESASLMGPPFRMLTAVGAFRWFIERQRLVNTFVSNVPGPSGRSSLCGAQIRQVVPVATIPGNVGVCFTALSWGPELTVSVIADPDVVADVDVVAQALGTELHRLVDGGT